MTLADFPGIERNVPLAGFSTFGVGGPADYFYTLTRTEELAPLLKAAGVVGVRVFVLGGGSNTLFLDEGFRGLVVRMAADEVHVEGLQLVADAGAKWPAVLEAMQGAGLTGLEAMAGLPGTVGGAVAGNAGCFGLEMADILERAEVIDLNSLQVQARQCEDFRFRYRWSRLKETLGVVLRAWLNLKHSEGMAHLPSDDIFKQRQQKQPPGKTGGSFFKNPSPQRPAGWLIEQCGLKGFKVGNAQISPKHANFFMNLGGATAADLLALRDRAKAAVQERFKILLEEEVVFVSASEDSSGIP